jgi:NDP-mannose synthase
MSNNKTAVILCGGVGTRLRPLTFVFPKPMMPLGKSNILEELIKKLKNNGFKNIILSVGYKHELISGYFGNGKKIGVNINYFY